MKRRREGEASSPSRSQSLLEASDAAAGAGAVDSPLSPRQSNQLKKSRVEDEGAEKGVHAEEEEEEMRNAVSSRSTVAATTTTTTLMNDEARLVAVGDKAPDFTADVVNDAGEFDRVQLSQYLGRYVVLIFYPLDFTFVCPTELLAINAQARALASMNCVPLGISVDSKYTHLAWLNTPLHQGGLGARESKFYIPLVSDLTRTISRAYGVLDHTHGHSTRTLVVVSDKGVVRAVVDNGGSVGRSTEELVRVVQALQHTDANPHEACPVDWKQGGATIVTTPTASKAYFAGDHMST
eukprot:TRINITY_DN4818_c1_g1_i3.p1 TRINITY_DN4818_c1_g1~~TRINITY_DN4818_c1_g1_i3.p1  ORF type:complete len:295 (-),score=66.32 TRINITY_DN4818_c1_g1_i3:70-954(-)